MFHHIYYIYNHGEHVINLHGWIGRVYILHDEVYNTMSVLSHYDLCHLLLFDKLLYIMLVPVHAGLGGMDRDKIGVGLIYLLCSITK